jgi:indoleamine 2,3-dioxygenase
MSTFTGTRDEAWFYLIPLGIELAGAPILQHLMKAFKSVEMDDTSALETELSAIPQHFEKMKSVLEQMYQNCDPNTFYWVIRPFLAGSDGVQKLPQGVHYEGVDPVGVYRKYPGSSAGQSALIHAFDVAFGVSHFSTGIHSATVSPLAAPGTYLSKMRFHMPKNQRATLEKFASYSSIREYVTRSSDKPLKEAFNACIDGFVAFRDAHLNMVARYIILPSKIHRKGLTGEILESLKVHVKVDMKADYHLEESDIQSPTDNTVKGTGGTDLIPFLKQTRDETIDTRIVR